MMGRAFSFMVSSFAVDPCVLPSFCWAFLHLAECDIILPVTLRDGCLVWRRFSKPSPFGNGISSNTADSASSNKGRARGIPPDPPRMLGCRRGERPGHEHAHPDLPDARMPGRPNPPDAPDGGMSQTPKPQTPKPQTPTPQTPTPQTLRMFPDAQDTGMAGRRDARMVGRQDARMLWISVYAGFSSWETAMPACILRFPYALVFCELPECSYVLTIVCSGGRRTFSDARGRVICGRPISRGMPMAIRRGASACGMPMAIWHGASAAPCGQKRPHSVTFAAFVFLRLGVCRESTCSRACAFDYLSKRIMNRGDFVQFASRSPLLPRSSKRPLRLACVALSCERLFRLVHVVLISRVPLCSRAPSPCPYRERPRVPQSGKCLPAPRFASPSRLPHPLRPAGSPRERPSGLACTRARLLVKKSSLVFCRSSAMSGAGFPPPPIRAFRVRKMTGGIRVFSSPRTESTLH